MGLSGGTAAGYGGAQIPLPPGEQRHEPAWHVALEFLQVVRQVCASEVTGKTDANTAPIATAYANRFRIDGMDILISLDAATLDQLRDARVRRQALPGKIVPRAHLLGLLRQLCLARRRNKLGLIPVLEGRRLRRIWFLRRQKLETGVHSTEVCCRGTRFGFVTLERIRHC
jgi:hypothetical protein